MRDVQGLLLAGVESDSCGSRLFHASSSSISSSILEVLGTRVSKEVGSGRESEQRKAKRTTCRF